VIAVSEQVTEHPEGDMPRGKRGWRWWAGVIMLVSAAVLGIFWLSERSTFRSAREKLAAIEAARAIPDEENAATIYNELRGQVAFSDAPSFLRDLDWTETWRSEEHPEAAQWLEGHQETIARLMEACRKEKCRFKMGLDEPSWQQYWRQHGALLNTIRDCANLLIRAANSDIGDGRIEGRREKYVCVIQMAKHVYQQQRLIDFLVAIVLESLALNNLSIFVVQANASQADLNAIEAALLPTANTWEQDSSRIREIDRLYARYQVGTIERLKWMFLEWRHHRQAGATQHYQHYLRILAHRRGTRILIALRRYKNEHSRWPRTLDDIKGTAPGEAFIDPRNDGSFVYKLTAGGFELYSTGPNKIDEDGKREDDADDQRIWPPISRKTKKEDANAERADIKD
jgi:hypothetical protein